LAIVLSVYFFNQSKNVEKRVDVSLSEIKQQTDTLQRLSGRMFDRLTRAVTESAPDHQERQMVLLVDVIKQFTSTTTLAQGSPVPPPQSPGFDPVTRDWILLLESAAYFYAGVSNFTLQSFLPPSVSALNERLRHLIDITNADFQMLDGMLQPVAAELKPPAKGFYEEASTVWKAHVRDALGAYQFREAQAHAQEQGEQLGT